MILKKIFPQLTAVFVLTAIVGYYHEAKATEQLAEVAQSVTSLKNPLKIANEPITLPPTGAPNNGRRGDAGSHNLCPELPQEEKPLTALVPDPNIHEAHTISERPTFWFYIPYPSDQVYIGKFMLFDRDDTLIDEQDITLPEEPGIIGLDLSETVTLSEGEYSWYFQIQCSNKKLTDLQYVEGIMKRIQLNSQTIQQIEMATSSQEKINLYRANGLWYELITMLAQEQGADWVELLEFVGLGVFSEDPIQFPRSLPES